MGTRADFYIHQDKELEWLGSIAFDGYPEAPGMVKQAPGLLEATTEEAYRAAVASRLTARDGTVPEQGWPWPWDTSLNTDCVYCFSHRKVWYSAGKGWSDPLPRKDIPQDIPAFPNMSSCKRVTFGPRSGLIVLRRRTE